MSHLDLLYHFNLTGLIQVKNFHLEPDPYQQDK